MQRVIHKEGYKSLHKVFDDLDYLYYELSEDVATKPLLSKVYDTSFKSLCNVFSDYSSLSSSTVPSKFSDLKYKPLDLPKYDDKNVIICFSGGKDSIALTLKCIQQGYKVHLYTVNHINPSIGDEIDSAKKVAEYLDIPLYVDDIRLGGHHIWMEHPMKNMLIANGAIQYGINNNIGTRILFGNYTTSFLRDNDFTRCAGDCIDMWDSYNCIIDKIIPGFHIEFGLENMGETLEIVTPRRDLLDLSISCLCRHSLRDYRRNWVKEKFGIELPQHRCGSCYKCCIEYIYMADHNLIAFSREYYRYCIQQLYRVHLNEVGPTLDINNIWYSYMFYDITESKILDDLKEARLFIKSIKWGNEHIVQKH